MLDICYWQGTICFLKGHFFFYPTDFFGTSLELLVPFLQICYVSRTPLCFKLHQKLRVCVKASLFLCLSLNIFKQLCLFVKTLWSNYNVLKLKFWLFAFIFSSVFHACICLYVYLKKRQWLNYWYSPTYMCLNTYIIKQ